MRSQDWRAGRREGRPYPSHADPAFGSGSAGHARQRVWFSRDLRPRLRAGMGLFAMRSRSRMVDPEPGAYRPRRAFLEPDPSEDESVTSDVDGSHGTLAESAVNGSRARRAGSRALPEPLESPDFTARETRESYGPADAQTPEVATPGPLTGTQSTSNEDIGSTGPTPAQHPTPDRSPAPNQPATRTSAPTGPPPAAASLPTWTTTTLPHRSTATAAPNRSALRKPRLVRAALVPRMPTKQRSTPVGRPGYGRRWRTPPVASGLQTPRRLPSCREPPPDR